MSKTKQQLAAELRSLKAVLAGETRQVQRLQGELHKLNENLDCSRASCDLYKAGLDTWYKEAQDLQQKLLCLMDENQSLKRPWYKRFFT